MSFTIVMDINTRVKEVIDGSGMSKSDLANRLEVSLAQLSHISSGRNKPGLDLIQKLLIQFPEISADWIINGQGDKYRKNGISGEIDLLLHKTEQKLKEMQLELKDLELQIREKRNHERH